MELIKRCTLTFFFLFILLATPFFCSDGLPELESGVYEIDYRGPETHSSIPPPEHARGRPMNRHGPPKSKGAVGNGQKVHG